MAKTRLTELQIRALKGKEKEYSVREPGGLLLRVLPGTGQKSWHYVYTLSGKRCRLQLGIYPAVSLSEARELHMQAVLLVKRGIDPRQALKQPEQPQEAAEYTVSDLIQDYIEYCQDQKSVIDKKYQLNKYLHPIAAMPVADVRRRDAVQLIDNIAANAPGMAQQVLKRARAMWTWAVDRERADYNPFAGVSRAVPAVRPKHRDRVLTDDEIRQVWQVLRPAKRGDIRSEGTRRALALILLTGQRPGEVSGMSAEELQLGENKEFCRTCQRCRWWTIPADRAKNGHEHDVYITPFAAALLPDRGEGPLFPAPQQPKNIMDKSALSHFVRRSKELNSLGFTPHDLRRTAATGLSRQGASDEVIDAVLNHVKTGIIRVYNRNKYIDVKQIWLQKWRDYVEQLVAE